MKKLTTLVLAAGLVVSSFAGSASAAEFKPYAQFAEEFTLGESTYRDETFNAATRIRFGFDYVASEDLSATILFQYGAHSWGDHNSATYKQMGTKLVRDVKFADDPDADLRMRLAYIDWTIPGTEAKVRMGRQAVVTPSYVFGSTILDGRADGVSVMGNVNENIALGFTWMRLDNEYADSILNDPTSMPLYPHEMDDSDAIMLTAEFAYDGFKVAPWGMYIVKQGHAWGGMPYPQKPDGRYPTAAHGDAYVLGLSAELSMFDPFVFAVDALYNNIEYTSSRLAEDTLDGYYVGASAAYKLSNGTLALKGWYSSGDENNEKTGKIHNDNGFVSLDPGFAATTILFGDNIIGSDAYNTLTGENPYGTWGAVAEYAGFSFIDKLTHTARVAYVSGTNDANPGHNTNETLDFSHITEDDNLIEIDFNSTYEIYKNLSATLELGYLIVDQDNLAPNVEEAENVFRSALTFVYNF